MSRPKKEAKGRTGSCGALFDRRERGATELFGREHAHIDEPSSGRWIWDTRAAFGAAKGWLRYADASGGGGLCEASGIAPKPDNFMQCGHVVMDTLSEYPNASDNSAAGVQDYLPRVYHRRMALPGLHRARLAKGFSQASLAERVGVEQPAVQRWEAGTREPDNARMRQLAVVLEVTMAELLGETATPPPEGRVFELPENNIRALSISPVDIPLYATALCTQSFIGGGPQSNMIPIEQQLLDERTVVGSLRRTPSLANRRGVYGVYVTGVSMSPRYEEADVVLVDPHRPAAIGDNVVVHLHTPDDDVADGPTPVLIKRLVCRTAEYVELEQYNPPQTFRVAAGRVARLHRIIPLAEIIGV